MKNKTLIIIFALIAAACAAVIIFSHMGSKDSKIAEIVLNGNTIQTIDLNAVDEPYDIRIDTDDGGYNIVHVENGAISVSEADCPDKVCVNQGKISSSTYPIVCLPHRLTIQIKTSVDNEIDAVVGR